MTLPLFIIFISADLICKRQKLRFNLHLKKSGVLREGH